METPLTPFQALVVGAIMGLLAKQEYLLIDVEPVMDEQGYTDEIRVIGKQSGERLLITVTPDLQVDG